MSDIKDGGSAFPSDIAYLDISPEGLPREMRHTSGGMSLRDWFAGQALGATLADTAGVHTDGAAFCKAVAENAYQLADAMIAARKTGGENV